MRWFDNIKLKNKLTIMVLPLVVLPIVIVGVIVGSVASKHAYTGMTETSRADLDHMAQFTLDMLSAHRQQFEVYREDKKKTVQRDMASLVNFAISLVEAHNLQYEQGLISLDEAQAQAAVAIKKVSIGLTGYAYAMTSEGTLVAHLNREGDNIYDERDESGRYFIREMCRKVRHKPEDTVHNIVYPWKNELLGDVAPRKKTVAYRYFKQWDWIVAAGSYLDETYEDASAEARSFEELKRRVKEKRVGQSGYIYALDAEGRAVIHPFREGEVLFDEVDGEGRYFIREMVEKRSGWIRYPWQNVTDPSARMKVVRYLHFEPWDWIVAVGSYENEFFAQAEAIRARVTETMLLLIFGAISVSVVLLMWASRVFTNPVNRMTQVIRRVRGGHLDERMGIKTQDEVGELAEAYDAMIEKLKNHRGLESTLAQQGKMASLGVLSSAVAHEINNPLGVILGYSAYLEKKLAPEDPNRQYVAQIRRECKRSKKIVQDLLSYSRARLPDFEPVALGRLLTQIAEFASHHPDMRGVAIKTEIDDNLPTVDGDGDQLRQVAMNLILNAGAAMEGEGRLSICLQRIDEDRVKISFADNGPGMTDEVREQIFEPFFTTRARGTGLGLAITKQIVERHQGVIEVKSQEGQGAQIAVILPIRHEEF
jgi:two-component system NtrC family sensor kinase